jgi:steroid delta-isomerase-like uncharacterized protein
MYTRGMSRDLIERYYRAFNQGDRPGMLALLTDDVAHDVNQGAREQGKAAFSQFLQHMDACYREQLQDIVIMGNPEGTRFAAEFLVLGEYLRTDTGLPPATGQRYRLPAGAFLEVKDGQICRVTTYYNLQQWLAQVGAR